MAMKRYRPEEIISKLFESDVLISQGFVLAYSLVILHVVFEERMWRFSEADGFIGEVVRRHSEWQLSGSGIRYGLAPSGPCG